MSMFIFGIILSLSTPIKEFRTIFGALEKLKLLDKLKKSFPSKIPYN